MTYILYICLIYVAIGLFFAIAFVTIGLSKLDEDAVGTSVKFKAIIFPGVVAFWPILLRKWLYVKRN